MQAAAKGKPDHQGRRTKLANSYQELLNEFSSSDLKSVGNYTLGRLIGKGSFGKVYLATHKLTNGSKVVLKSANKNDSNLAREIHHHRQFVHPHIARLYEVIVTENLVWLVLEYCSGDELYNYLLDHGPLAIDKVQKIFAQLVGAVSYVHLQSCVHRDLKLENILFDRHENVKLVDFGFTREYEGRVNHLQTFCGTICYSAPEMLKGEKYAGEKVDVWSLGIILYSLLCGELPFDDDDDNVTRSRILGQEPKYPDHLSPDAVALIKSLLSKRPILRPSLPEILAHPFLADHAPAQQAILEIMPQPPFTSPLEKDCLQRMRSAGVDIDAVIESVLSQRCDALTGWWILLLEKEERKMKRREIKRREKETERSLRRLSAASSRLERLAPTLQDVDEDSGLTSQFIRIGDQHSQRRGRSDRRSAGYYDITITDLPELTEVARENGSASGGEAARPADNQSIRSVSTSLYRPIPPPKEGVIRSARSRGSTLHLITTADSLNSRAQPSPGEMSNGKANGISKWKKKPSIMAHWKHWTHWFKENAKVRRKGHERHASRSTPDLHNKERKHTEKDVSPRPQTSKYPNSTSGAGSHGTAPLPKSVVANGHYGKAASPGRRVLSRSSTTSSLTPSHPHRPRVSSSNSHSYKRQSISPAPMTPRSTVRRSSAGLRGRKSTSSSVSSVRSLHHHHHTHSKASSTSSTRSVSASKTPLGRTHSPHHSVKVLPATPTLHAFPSNIRLVRGSPAPAPLQLYNEGMPGGSGSSSSSRAPGSPNPFAGGVQFAKRKRNLFKGPSLNLPTISSSSRTSSAGSHSRSGSGSGMRRSTDVAIPEIQEEDEDRVVEEDDEIEEVEAFNPIVGGPGEIVEEQIIEDDELPSALDLDDAHPAVGTK
ncbi:hypothetical protein ARSEF4850_005108 [Beauveria asiatica]